MLQMNFPPADDGYLRLRLRALKTLALHHLISGLDEEVAGNVQRLCGGLTSISGYTEWICHGEPRLSIGWDWALEVRAGEIHCIRSGLPRSSIMLIDEASNDFGCLETLQSLATAIDTFSWGAQTRAAILQRYGF